MSSENSDYQYTDEDVERMMQREIEETMEFFYTEKKSNEEVIPANYKIHEYVQRMMNGETLESFGDIPTTWKKQILDMFEVQNSEDEYFMAERASNNLIFDEDIDIKDNEAKIDIEKNKKLTGWSASYELARIAREEGKDLSLMDREEYAEYAIKNYLAIDDTQLRAHPSQRNCTSVGEVLTMAKLEEASLDPEVEKNFAKFSVEMKELASRPQKDRFLRNSGDVRVSSGTANSDSWLFFTINQGMDDESNEAYKSYFSFRDLNALTPSIFVDFMIFLQDNGYNGSIKIFQDMEFQGTRLNDQVVMHGFSEDDSKLALDLANQYFGEDIGSTSFGKDEVVDGRNMSYSQILAKKISDKINDRY